MRYLRYFALLLAVLTLPAVYSHAGVSFRVQVGPTYAAPPSCPYGYYAYYPYACAPYGYYGPNWFENGVFIGAGPWYHHYSRPVYYYDDDDYYRPRHRGCDRHYRRDWDDEEDHYYRHHDHDSDRDDYYRHHDHDRY